MTLATLPAGSVWLGAGKGRCRQSAVMLRAFRMRDYRAFCLGLGMTVVDEPGRQPRRSSTHEPTS